MTTLAESLAAERVRITEAVRALPVSRRETGADFVRRTDVYRAIGSETPPGQVLTFAQEKCDHGSITDDGYCPSCGADFGDAAEGAAG